MRKAIILLLLIVAVTAYAEEYRIDIHIPSYEREIINGKSFYSIADFGSTVDNYLPAVPSKTYFFEISMNTKNVKVLPDTISTTIIDNDEMLEVLPPMPANNDPDYVKPKRKQHNLTKYPETYYRYNGIKIMDDHKLVSITLFPIQYYFSDERVEYVSDYSFTIDYKITKAKKPKKKDADSPTEALASEIISNYNDVPTAGDIPIASTQDLPSGTNIKYAIITTSALSSALTPLKEWKSEKGVPAEIYLTSDMYANYSGYDNAEKIRNFLIELEASDDLDWILLAGDDADIPARDAYCDDGYAGDGDYVPTDHYYADLEGNYSPYDWDKDNDTIYGEVADDIDWLPEAYVGRLSTSNLTQMETMVTNIINYEKSPSDGAWTNKVILAGAKSDDTTDEATLMERVRTDLLSEFTSEKLYYLTNYTRDHELTFSNLESAITNGSTLINWAGHGSYTSAHVTDVGAAFVSTATNPNNGNMTPFVYADSCNTGGFDQSTNLGESIVRDWGIGFIGASRVSWYCVGWSSPAQPWNQAHDYRFFEQLVGNDKYRPGKALFDSKVDYITDFASSYGVDSDMASRKNIFNYNLLGDPELNIWTRVPENITISHNSYFVVNSDNDLQVNVSYSANGTRLYNAKVTLYNGETYLTNYTDSNGCAKFNDVSIATVADIMVTVTKHNIVPEQSNISYSLAFNVTPISPDGTTFTNPDSINFTFFVNSTQSISSCDLRIDGNKVVTDTTINANTNETITWENVEGGNHSWGIKCTNNLGASNMIRYRDLTVIEMSNIFDGNTTNLSEVDINNVTNLIVERRTIGAINFTESVNLSTGIDFESSITISNNLIEIDSTYLPNLNKSAILTIKNISIQNPTIMRDGVVCNECQILETGADWVRFSVEHFTAYSVSENSQLTIFSSGEAKQIDINETVRFYANYTNITSGEPISQTNCTINISGDSTDYNMTYNLSTKMYEFDYNFSADGSYDYNITCVGIDEGFTSLSATTSVSIGKNVLSVYGGQYQQLNVTHNQHTDYWYFMFGQINSSLSIGDGKGNTAYNWSTTRPSYLVAARAQATFTGIRCANNTDISNEENYLDINPLRSDSISNAFGVGNHPDITIGPELIESNTCNTTHTNVNSTNQTDYFKEVLLFDTANDQVLYTTYIYDDVYGYNYQEQDYQIMIPEDGTNLTDTTYFIYLEI